MNYYIDIATQSLNKVGEELCGDKVEIFRDTNRTVIVLADGLGSGVKANILATMTTKIAGTMLIKGESIEETVDTLMKTLPVCQVRKIAYSTFGVISIDPEGNCVMLEYDNPPIFILRKGTILSIKKRKISFDGKIVQRSSFHLQEGDSLTLCSDGVIHAGVGETLNHGWEWEHVASFLSRQSVKTADQLNQRLIDACAKLYNYHPGDDTTAVTVKLRAPENLSLFTGPPIDPDDDSYLVKKFMKQGGKKIVCGGTAANILSRELHREIETCLDYLDPEIPPVAKMKGIDLVTEGVLTLQKTIDRLEAFRLKLPDYDPARQDGATRLAKLLINDSTHIQFFIGRAINPAHQNPDFPAALSIKMHVVESLMEELKKIGKEVQVHRF
ncbi:SpoIIE family protein phosphatase [Gottschalkiaceae bacterium SANA]|nr:SpoIIE family protein phosphatase [Gottschalkiaceae bacterium SANA]